MTAWLLLLALSAPDAGTHASHVDHQGDIGMGFSHQKTEHHFVLTPTGGRIVADVKDPADTASLEAIRGHFRHIAQAFSHGDFDLPMFIHGKEPPGVPVMKQRASKITYREVDTPRGGRVDISTSDPEAIAAVHDFLRFQISDHRTGDPTTVQR